jgi:MFS family permease
MIKPRALSGVPWKATAPSIFLVLNSFVWYTLTYTVFVTVVDDLASTRALPPSEPMALFICYFLGIAFSALIGPKIFPNARAKALTIWMLFGGIATLSMITFPINGTLANAIFSLFLGTSIGIGLPSCLSYFADSTSIERRGVVSGVIWSGVGCGVVVLAFLISSFSPEQTILLLTVWRLLGSAGFLALNRNPQQATAKQKSQSYLEIIRKKEVLLYLFPWIMFSIINFAESPILGSVFGPVFFRSVQLAEFALIGVFAVVGGVMADTIGRKKVVISGFVMLGIEYAAMSVFSGLPGTVYLFLVLDGATWGLFAAVFFTALWGDLGENRQKDKYYALGGLPFLLANFLYIVIRPIANSISSGMTFSFASFFLFVAVIPLMYATETLPEKTVKDRELKSYIERAKREVEKTREEEANEQKEESKPDESEPKEDVEFQVGQEELEKPCELADKYY